MEQFAKEAALVLEKIGLTTVLIPFMLTFVLLYAVLQKTKVLGKERDGKPRAKLNAVIAVAASLFVIAYADTVAVINRIAQYGVVLLIAGFVALVIFTFTGFPKMGSTKLMKIVGSFVFILFVFYVLGGFDWIDSADVNMKILAPTIAIITFIIAVYLIMKGPKETEENKKETVKKELPQIQQKEEQSPTKGFR